MSRADRVPEALQEPIDFRKERVYEAVSREKVATSPSSHLRKPSRRLNSHLPSTGSCGRFVTGPGFAGIDAMHAAPAVSMSMVGPGSRCGRRTCLKTSPPTWSDTSP